MPPRNRSAPKKKQAKRKEISNQTEQVSKHLDNMRLGGIEKSKKKKYGILGSYAS